MAKRIKFKFKELEEVGKVLVWVDYIDRKFFNEDYSESWTYNNIYFNIATYCNIEKGDLTLKYKDESISKFELYLGLKENMFIVDKNEVKIFKNLENIVYNSSKRLSEYLYKEEIKCARYYFIEFNSKELKFFVNYFKLIFDDIDKNLFKIGNMFKFKNETKEYINKLNSNKITLDEIKKERQEFFKDYKFE